MLLGTDNGQVIMIRGNFVKEKTVRIKNLLDMENTSITGTYILDESYFIVTRDRVYSLTENSDPVKWVHCHYVS